MKNEFVALLREIKGHLEKSHDSVWSSESVEAMMKLVSESIETLEAGRIPDNDELVLAFLPTSYLQEISMENGWSGEYLRLSSRIDKYIES
jgi:hypothetical protein